MVVRAFNLHKDTNVLFEARFKIEWNKNHKMTYSAFADILINEGLTIHDRLKTE